MDTGLPIDEVIPDVLAALDGRGIAVLTAPPGSGKTTVVPLALLDEDWIESRRITVLEPRRIATRAAARRMAWLLGEAVGDRVGYITRDDRRVSERTRIEVVTEGVLTRRLQQDPSLPGSAAVIFDEVHERSLNTDLGLALTLESRASLRPDLRVLLMSATLDAERLSAAVASPAAPIVESDGWTHPVDVTWVPPARRTRLEDAVAATVGSALDRHEGDLLVFLPGMGEIRRTQARLEERGVYADVRILHGSLPASEQDLAIEPGSSGRPKVVLSTDIAETSLTVEGVRVVVDSGLTRVPRFDARTGMTRLATVPISKASAEQRSGRAGRTEPGWAYRLWSKIEHAARPAHIAPEITQVDLAGFMLELALWGTMDPSELVFLDSPPPSAVAEAVSLLHRLGAIEDGRITASGRRMATLPVHPRLARMITDAGIDQALACTLAALVDERDILSGRPDDVPTDLSLRVRTLDGTSHRLASGRRIERVRRTAQDLMRRADAVQLPIDPDRTGAVLGLAFPDRLSIRRGGRGRFQMRTGTTAWMPADDSLAGESFLIAVDLDGKRSNTRIRQAAPVTAEQVSQLFADDVTTTTELEWVDDRLVERRRRRLGGLTLDEHEQRPSPGPETVAALMAECRRRDLRPLTWTRRSSAYRERVSFLHEQLGPPWPDWSLETLTGTLDDWLAPAVPDATGLDDLATVDLLAVLKSRLPHQLHAELERQAPARFTLPSGRSVDLDYSTGETPRIAVKVQEVFGITRHPIVGGRPLTIELLSPADRPIQITSDLAGFWSGSWHDVRKDMAGRYPKHDWPEDPTSP